MPANEYYKQEIIHNIAEGVQRGGRVLNNVPGLIAKMINEDLWQERVVEGETVVYQPNEFKSFVEAHYPTGLGTTIETLEALCKHEPRIMAYLADAKRGKRGRPVGKTNEGAEQVDSQGHVVNSLESKAFAAGETREYSFQRLKDEAFTTDERGQVVDIKNPKVAKLYEQVLDKKMSPNAAMVQAGFRPRRRSINMDDPESAARTIQKHMSNDDIAELIRMLKQ